jgi:LCP family protein required for cell wall assembly
VGEPWVPPRRYPDAEGARGVLVLSRAMRTTLKRGIGRSAASNGNGHAVLPPALVAELAPVPVPQVTRYRQPPPARRGVLRTLVRGFLWLVASAAVVALGLAGGAYLYVDEDVIGAVQPREREVREAAKRLDIPEPDQPAIALVVGYDKRAFGPGQQETPRSDTLMLVRADPKTKALSLFSFPRDLLVDIRCPGRPDVRARINAAYSECGVKGSLETVRAITGLPINYLITVNFRGFRKLVARVGGVWVDVDRRYFNDNSGYEQFATINLQPGYQKLNGSNSLDFVRYRHTDNDFYRLARQQLFVSAFRGAITTTFSATNIPKIVKTITDNVQVGVAGNKEIDKKTLWQYALLAYQLPSGHVFQSKLEGLTDDGFFNVLAPEGSIKTAVEEFVRPDTEAPDKATDVALGRKPAVEKAPPAGETSIVVLNGNGVAGAAANTSYLLGQRGYRMLIPDGRADAPSFDYFHTTVYFDRKQRGAGAAARKLAQLFAPADVEWIPKRILPFQSGAMIVVVVGQTFTGELAPAPVDKTPRRQPPAVVKNPDATLGLLREAQKKVRFPLLVPTVLERASYPDRHTPVRVYKIAGRPAVRLVLTNGVLDYWGIQMTSWRDAPILEDPNETVTLGGRRYELHYAGPKLHMVVLRDRGATYWVVNTLLNSLSNETMLAVAKGLKPLR